MMKQLIQIFVTLATIFVCSCNNKSISTEYALLGIPFEDNDGDKYGLIDAKGEIVAKNFEDAASPIINGYFSKENEDGSLVLCKIEGDSYEELSSTSGYDSFGVMNNGLVPACKEDGHIVILNENGNVAFTLESYDNSDVIGCASYSSNKMRVKLMNESVIYLDKSGNKLFDKSFDWGTDFINEKAIVSTSYDDYSLITGDGNVVFSFKGEDEDYVKISHEHELICSKNEDVITIYDFQGKIVCKCPEKVEEIYDFGDEYFVFKKDSEYGLMSYNGIELIRAKYDKLVFNGNTLLAIHEDKDDEVLILDSKGNVIGTLDGEEIYSAKEYGFDFPNIIKREDDEIYLVNKDNKIIGSGSKNIEVDLENLEYVSIVRSLYFPQNEVLKIVMDLCGDGTGLPKDQGAFFAKGSTHCYPSDVKLLTNCPKDKLIGKRSYNTNISEGVNYLIDFEVSFDEPIIREGSSELSSTAWLNGMKITVTNSSMFRNAAFFNLCRQTLEDTYDCEVTAKNKNDYVLTSNNNENLIILVHGEGNYFYIYLRQRNESTLAYWTKYIRI